VDREGATGAGGSDSVAPSLNTGRCVMYKIIVDIFEGEERKREEVVTHVFYGRSLLGAAEIEEAHRTTDMFYRAAIEGRDFRRIRLSAEVRIERDTEDGGVEVINEFEVPKGLGWRT